MNTAETKSYDIIGEDNKVIEDYIVEHQIVWQIVLKVSRILGYLVLLIASLFNNMMVYKTLLFLVTIVIIFYSKLMISLDKEKIA